MQHSYPDDNTRYAEAPAMYEIPMEQQNPFQNGQAHQQYAYGQYQQPNEPRYAPPVPYNTRPADAGYTGSQVPLVPAVSENEKRSVRNKWRKRLYWIVPLALLALGLAIAYLIFHKDFERWVQPLANWLQARKAWSWLIPVGILIVLCIPPLFGHEIVFIVVGLTFSLGEGIGIASAGMIIGEALVFLMFKYIFTGYVDKKRAKEIKWEATARVCQEAGFWGVMVIRYSIIPGHLVNPVFATTGMAFWKYMASVVLSLPKTLVFVALGNPNNEHKAGAKVGKIIAVAVLVLVTIFATWWIRKKTAAATIQIEAERAGAGQLKGVPQTIDANYKTGSYGQPAYGNGTA